MFGVNMSFYTIISYNIGTIHFSVLSDYTGF